MQHVKSRKVERTIETDMTDGEKKRNRRRKRSEKFRTSSSKESKLSLSNSLWKGTYVLPFAFALLGLSTEKERKVSFKLNF
jgi:hypothetical protein